MGPPQILWGPLGPFGILWDPPRGSQKVQEEEMKSEFNWKPSGKKDE